MGDFRELCPECGMVFVDPIALEGHRMLNCIRKIENDIQEEQAKEVCRQIYRTKDERTSASQKPRNAKRNRVYGRRVIGVS